MAQQTAVEWLEKQLAIVGIYVGYGIYEQAKQMEKEQIMDAHYVGFKNFVDTKEISEQYYNETYNENSPVGA